MKAIAAAMEDAMHSRGSKSSVCTSILRGDQPCSFNAPTEKIEQLRYQRRICDEKSVM
jgi:hypothetical protein